MSTLTEEQQAEASTITLHFRLAAVAVVVAISGGATVYHFVEGWGWVDSFYFCTVTLSTVGYGDFSPVTTTGKIFTIFYILMGIGLLATFANLALKRAVVVRKQRGK